MKIHASGFNKHFQHPAGCKVFSLQEVVKMLEEMVVSW